MNDEQISIPLTLEAESRHPEDQSAYDPKRHAYRTTYVRPSSWRLSFMAELPPDVKQCNWKVSEESGDFTISGAFPDEGPLSVELPHPGKYQLTLKTSGKDDRSYSAQHPVHLRDHLVVAVGDSYFCGEGSPDIPGKPNPVANTLACNLATFTKFLIEKADIKIPMTEEPVWQEEKVHRSYKAGPSLAARGLQDTAKAQVITFLNFARSGASIEEGLLNPMSRDDWTELGQLAEAKQALGNRPIDALLISIGGNDIQFSDRLIDLMRDDLVLVGAGGLLGDEDLNRQRELEEAKKLLAALPGKFDRLAEAVAELGSRYVFLFEYPIAHYDLLNDEGEVVTSSACGIFDDPDMNIDETDAASIKETGKKLNNILHQAAHKNGWIFVEGIAEGFAGHGLCSDDKFFYSAEESCHIQGDFRGTLHPNEKGIQVYARCIETALNEHLLTADE